MTIIAPSDVVNALVVKLETNKVTLGITNTGAIDESSKPKDLQPPYCAAYANFESESEEEASGNIQLSLPVEIKVLCSSGDNQTSALSFAEAFQIANKAIAVCKGVLTVDTSEVILFVRKRPFDILMNRSDQSIIQLNLYYNIVAIGAE